MSNRLTIEPTKFVNIRTGSETFGFRMYDDFAGVYANDWDVLPEDNMQFLQEVIQRVPQYDEETQNMLGYVEEHEKGIYLADVWYDWDQIKHLFEEDEETGQ